jgi:hypothetical protein
MQLWDYPKTVGRVDTTGFDIEGRDGTVGKVAEAVLEAGSSYLVVDTGSWIFGKKVSSQPERSAASIARRRRSTWT